MSYGQNKKYVFISGRDYAYEVCRDRRYFIYQICMFPNKTSGKYQVRKITFCENMGQYSVTDVRIGDVTEDIYKKMLVVLPRHMYQLYQSFTLDEIGLPDTGNIQLAGSDLLDNGYVDYYDHGAVSGTYN